MQDTLSLEDVRADFDLFISQRKWDDANALLDNLWNNGFKNEALILGRTLTAVKMNINHEPKDHWEAEQDRAMERDTVREFEGANKEVW